ncbi:chaperonin 10-like protein [Podospora appendiculata]|uniref:Chaperonin 10-like protein n=1 Tax=Podospora appendiculata TaxID=314037 RepID=A0AAE0X8I6_9PEZI|nr:chaperonin 10-like protein [Podospora appendiculata]
MAALPSEMRSITITAPGKAEIVTGPPPQLRDDYILVRTTAVALNPTDWKHVDGAINTGARVGCDFAGVVEAVGSRVTKAFARGDRVCGFAHGSNRVQKEDGTFAEYIVAKGDLQIKTPDNLTDEQAATLGVGISTVGQGLYQALKLPLPTAPSETPIPLLIYGGSTATGILGIQFAKLSGCTVAATCSPSNFEYLRSLGADAVFDYRSPTALADIKAWSAAQAAPLTRAWDCIASAYSARLCAGALSDAEPGLYRSLLRVDPAVVTAVNAQVDTAFTFAYTMIGEAFDKGFTVPARPEDFEFGKMWWELSRELLEQGKVKPASPVVNRGGKGLEGVLFGLRELKEGRVSAGKLVYTL